jgi:hypothetical protein
MAENCRIFVDKATLDPILEAAGCRTGLRA